MGIREFIKLMTRSYDGCIFCGREIPGGDIGCEKCMNDMEDCYPNDCRTGGVLHVYQYEGPVRELLRRYKYDDRPRYSFFIAQKMAEFMEREGVEADMVTHVPVHENRKRERGYDQSEMLAANISSLMDIEFGTLLERTRDTMPQYRLSAKRRSTNVSGAFSAVPGCGFEGKKILLVDDIYTTGATMAECAAALSGGAEVIPFVFAREYME